MDSDMAMWEAICFDFLQSRLPFRRFLLWYLAPWGCNIR